MPDAPHDTPSEGPSGPQRTSRSQTTDETAGDRTPHGFPRFGHEDFGQSGYDRGSDSWSQHSTEAEASILDEPLVPDVPADTPGESHGAMNPKAVPALVLGGLIAPIGIVLGLIARQENRRSGERGWGVATGGVCLGIAVLAILFLIFVLPQVLILISEPGSHTTSIY